VHFACIVSHPAPAPLLLLLLLLPAGCVEYSLHRCFPLKPSATIKSSSLKAAAKGGKQLLVTCLPPNRVIHYEVVLAKLRKAPADLAAGISMLSSEFTVSTEGVTTNLGCCLSFPCKTCFEGGMHLRMLI
jgi:hypothetical protein